MTTSHPFFPFEPNRLPESSREIACPVRNEADVVAVCVHTLGFWPENSLVLLTSGKNGLGPLIRVDLADPQDDDPDAYLDYFMEQLPLSTEEGNRLDHIFAVFFCDREGAPPRTELSMHHWFNPVADSAEKEFVASIQAYIAPLQRVSEKHNVSLIDAIAVGKGCLWALEYPDGSTLELAGSIDTVLASKLYREMLTNGSRVAASHAELLDRTAWNPLETCDPSERDYWLTCTELAAREYLAHKTKSSAGEMQQMYVELHIWDAALTRCAHRLKEYTGRQEAKRSRRSPRSADEPAPYPTAADLLRKELGTDTAAYLIASLNSTATLQLVVHLACGRLTPALQALAAINSQVEVLQGNQQTAGETVLPQKDTLSRYELPSLGQPGLPQVSQADQATGMENMAATLCGHRTDPPNWHRLTALGAIAALLENSAHDKPESLLKIAQAWVYWFHGKSTAADTLLATADPTHYGSDPTVLHHVLQTGTLPAWITHSAVAPWQT